MRWSPGVEASNTSAVQGVQKNPLGSTGIEGSLPISVDCADFGHTYVCGAYSWLSRAKCRKASWGSYAKLRVMEGRVDLSHATGITSLIAVSVLKSVHETLAWITPSPVTWTCWIVGIHVGSITMLATTVSPACRRLFRVGVCNRTPAHDSSSVEENAQPRCGRSSPGAPRCRLSTRSRTSAPWRCRCHLSGVSLDVCRSRTRRRWPGVACVGLDRLAGGEAPCLSSLDEELE